MRRYHNLSTYRLLSTILIIIFHLFFCMSTYMPSYVGLFSKCVQGLTVLSGLLYGSKVIKDTKGFYKKNLKKLMLPVLIAFALTGIATLIMFAINPTNNYLSYWFGTSANGGLLFVYGNLWYIPMIIVCYLMTPVLQKTRESNGSEKYALIALVILSVLVELSLGFAISSFPYSYFCYVVGYFVGSNKDAFKKLTDTKFYFLPLMASLSLNILVYSLYMDAEIFGLAASYMSNLLASVFGMLTFFSVALLIKPINNLTCLNDFFKFTDRVSYPAYIQNQIFMTGSFIFMSTVTILSGFVITAVTILSAVLIDVLSQVTKFRFHKSDVKPLNAINA